MYLEWFRSRNVHLWFDSRHELFEYLFNKTKDGIIILGLWIKHLALADKDQRLRGSVSTLHTLQKCP